MSRPVVTPFRTFAHGLPAYREARARPCSTGSTPAAWGAGCCCASRDTDRARSTEAAITAILDGLSWLGLDHDGEVFYQHARADRHREAVDQLLAAGKAYYCYASQDELTAMREQARAEGRPMRYDGRWRDRDPAEAPEGVKPVVRLKAPQQGETVVDDQVQGRVSWQNKDLDDLVAAALRRLAHLHARRRGR